MTPITLGSRTWSTKATARKYFQAVLNGQEPLIQDILQALLQRHPHAETKGSGEIVRILSDRGGYCFAVRNPDGDRPFSYPTCLKSKPSSPLHDISVVMRCEIEPQIMSFRRNTKVPACGHPGPYDVDHIRPFSDIRDAWISETG